MKKIKTAKLVSVLAILLIATATATAQNQLYAMKQFRAAPGELLHVIELLKADIAAHKKYGIEKPYLMRHSQGDQWDLLLIYPIVNMADEFSDKYALSKGLSKTFGKSYGAEFFKKISWQQEAIVAGPPVAEFSKWFDQFDYYHVEIFTSLAGKQGELLRQREMENVYLNEINRRPNFIFTRVYGPSWDIFTIGFYKDVKDYAASADIPSESKEKAAVKAGFESANTIGSYLRELILEHHDTLAGVVRGN